MNIGLYEYIFHCNLYDKGVGPCCDIVSEISSVSYYRYIVLCHTESNLTDGWGTYRVVLESYCSLGSHGAGWLT